jgi:hypothetical protein
MMALGSFIAWAWLPEVQDQLNLVQRDATKGHPKFVSKKLEDLAVGWRVAAERGEVTGLREKFANLFNIRKETHTDIELPVTTNSGVLTGVSS